MVGQEGDQPWRFLELVAVGGLEQHLADVDQQRRKQHWRRQDRHSELLVELGQLVVVRGAMGRHRDLLECVEQCWCVCGSCLGVRMYLTWPGEHMEQPAYHRA